MNKELEKAQASDNEEENEDTETEGEGEEETEKGCAKKSDDLTQDDLEKSLGLLTDYAESGDELTRKQVLLEKAQQGELDKSERAELFEILGAGEKAPEQTFSDEIEKAMEPSEDLQKALDVSDFLNETHEETKRVYGMIADRMEKSDNRQHEFNLILAKAVTNIGNLTKAVSERLGVIEDQPARAPKSTGAKTLEKSFADNPPVEGQLSKSEILNTMSALIEESANNGNAGAVGGIDLVTAATKYEQFNTIHPNVLNLVKQKRGLVH